MSKHSRTASLLAACAAGALITGPAAFAAPNSPDPGCAALQTVQTDINNAGMKLNGFVTTVGSFPAQYQQSDLLGMAANLGKTGQKAQELVDSMHQLSGDLENARDQTADPGLRDSIDKLVETANEAGDYAGAYANPLAQKPDNTKLTTLGVQAAAQAGGYQIQYMRVCGLGSQLGGLSANNPAQPGSAPAPTSANPPPAAPPPAAPGEN